MPPGTDAVILAGGLGTRLRSVVPDRPKVLAEVAGRPFLGVLLDHLFSQGVGRAVLCVSYRKEQIVEYVRREKAAHDRWGAVVFSEENEPLGTGGAVKNAEEMVRSEHFFVLNGDTLSGVPLPKLYDAHRSKNGMLTIAVAPVPGRADVGSIDLGPDGRIKGFRERAAERAGFVNAGTYVMQKDVFRHMPSGVFSLETDFFPDIVARQPCYAFVADVDVLDIGTPERYTRAKEIFKGPDAQ